MSLSHYLKLIVILLIMLMSSSAIAHPLIADPVDYPLVSGFDRFYAPEDDEGHIAEGGLLLLGELQCVSCHGAPKAWKDRLPALAKLSLAGVGSRLSADDLWLFVRSPQHRKKGTTMPGLFSGDDRDDVALEAITEYLSSLKEPVKKYPQGDVERGRKLYHTIGCVACHEPAKIEDYRPVEAPPNVAVEQPGLPSVPVLFADRYDRDALVAFLLNPLKMRPSGRMPATQMTEQEAADVAAYLQINQEPMNAQERAVLKIKAPGVEQGRQAFITMNCVACHDAGGEQIAAESPKTLMSLQSDHGCLTSQKKAGVPDYGLSDFQKRAIKLALAKIKAEPVPVAQTASEMCDAIFVRLNCFACHEWNGKGGLEEPRAQYFTCDPAAHQMGEVGRLPPKLDQAGQKITPDWLEKMFWGEDGGVRPHMTARMPRYGKANAEPLVVLLEEASRPEKPVKKVAASVMKHPRAEDGRVLMGVGKGGLGCVNCHGLKESKSLEIPAINLTRTIQRLQPDYFKEILLKQHAPQIGALVPPVLMGRKNADEEIEQIWTYLKEIDRSRMPDGLVKPGH